MFMGCSGLPRPLTFGEKSDKPSSAQKPSLPTAARYAAQMGFRQLGAEALPTQDPDLQLLKRDKLIAVYCWLRDWITTGKKSGQFTGREIFPSASLIRKRLERNLKPWQAPSERTCETAHQMLAHGLKLVSLHPRIGPMLLNPEAPSGSRNSKAAQAYDIMKHWLVEAGKENLREIPEVRYFEQRFPNLRRNDLSAVMAFLLAEGYIQENPDYRQHVTARYLFVKAPELTKAELREPLPPEA